MSLILNRETKIEYQISHNWVDYETFIEHIKNKTVSLNFITDKNLTIYIDQKNKTSGKIIINRNVKYSVACNTVAEISKHMRKIKSIEISNYYISKEHINLINLIVGDHYVKIYNHQLICDLPIHFQFKFKHLKFHINLCDETEFDIYQQIDYMCEMIKFYNSKIMTLQFRNNMFDLRGSLQHVVIKYMSEYLSEQNIKFVKVGSLFDGYRIQYSDNFSRFECYES